MTPQRRGGLNATSRRTGCERGGHVVRMLLAVTIVVFLERPAVCASNRALTASAESAVCYHRFLDLNDPCAVRDANGEALLTFAAFDANDTLIRTQGFAGIDAWRTHAASAPRLADSKTEQVGWRLAGGDEGIFWHLRALVYLCPEYDHILAAIESRPLVYDGNTRTWVAPGVELTDGINYLDQFQAIVNWNPTTSSAYGGGQPWDRFPPLVALAHELAHAYQRIAEDSRTYSSPLQVAAMQAENLVRGAFYRKVPGYADIKPRPGNLGVYLGGAIQYLFDTFEWLDWAPGYAPLLDVFEE